MRVKSCYNSTVNEKNIIDNNPFDKFYIMKDLTNIPKGTCECSVCKEVKDNTEFSWYKHRLTKDGYRLRVNTYCDPCAKATSKELAEIKKVLLKDHPRPEYGESCDLCGKPVYKHKREIPEGVDGRWGWQCDHDHESKEFRGWLCKSCNTGLGGIGDTIESVENALRYLLEAKKTNVNNS